MASLKTIQVEVNFDVPDEEGCEYVVEQTFPGDNWTEVAKGTTSPILFTTQALGTYSVRMWTREIANPANMFGPSNTTSVEIPKAVPGNVKMIVKISK